MSVNIPELKERWDLVEAFSEFVGPVKREGSEWKAPCPNPQHAQTGESPPASVHAEERWWNCFGCDAGGDVINLAMYALKLSKGEAIDFLARRVGLAVEDRPSTDRRSRPAPKPAAPKPPAPELVAYVERCEQDLWGPAGAEVLSWLRARGFSDETLRSQRVGADLAGRQQRPKGLRSALSAIFPVLSAGRVVFAQQRVLHPGEGQPKWNNLHSEVAANPRLAVVSGPHLDGAQTVMVCEGMPDALTAFQAGYPAVSLLGTQTPSAEVAAQILEAFPAEHLVLAFDGDEPGAKGADKLTQLLAETADVFGKAWRLTVPETVSADPKQRDLNQWAIVAGEEFAAQLETAAAGAEPAGWKRPATAADLVPKLLEELADQAGALAIPTGVRSLDHHLASGGWRPGLVLMAGLPGLGKTAFALQTALVAARAGHPVLFVSVEQSEEEILGRLFCREAQAPISAFWNRDPHFVSAARTAAASLPLGNLYIQTDPFHVEDRLGTVGRVRGWANDIERLTGARPLVIVDYLQRMRPPESLMRQDERVRISFAGHQLRQLARDLKCPVLVVSSIGRGSYEGLPRLDWFKGSGDLEYDADACIILRPAQQGADPNQAQMDVELHLVKNRYGRLTNEQPVELRFDRRFGTFREMGLPPRVPAP